MDEDLLKRNTDCVYFLASPLTCKKGVECEYRHHEIARLNPRDCWYWLSGNCLNPTCAFRHPPLDGHAGVPSEPIQSSVPASANKTMVPCYFFFNGFCNKGSKCSFSHKPDDSLLVVKPSKNDVVKPSKNDIVKPLKSDTVKPLKSDTVKPLKSDTVKPLKNDTVKPLKNDTVKPLKNGNGSINALNLENKASSGNKTSVASTPRETNFEQSLSAPKALSDIRLKSKEDLQLPLPENVKQQSVCLEFSSFDYNEAAVTTQSDSLVPDNGFAHNMSHSCSEQSSEEQENCHVEPEERWESSPGFDVLVHDETENLGYENGSEYLPLLDMDDHELNEHYTGYEFKNTDEYDTICSDADILYEQGTCDDYRCFDRDFSSEREVCGYSREIALDSIFSRKRVRISAAAMDACDSDLDLRDHLRRRREVNDPPVTDFLRHDEPSSLMVRNQERHRRGDIIQRPNRRLTSQLGFSSIREVEDPSIANNNKHRLFRPSQQNWPSQQNRPRKHYREKPARRPFPSSKVSRKPFVKLQRVIKESSAFSGPKTLAEIKEERKKKAGESSHCESSSAGFQDPKPLHEILKDRRTMD
ncbi:zinc finger CCCH domain-containing protein 32-like [Vicia villosa]|uniref:zinc finger CCCH domain-containing protein 32-like n=1 Tax=Vicia villosa TaxID=3911 RepID=UPI00273A84D5|nr:zinc finger CCCH domain-containing protein 32-like [Vicia villosa]